MKAVALMALAFAGVTLHAEVFDPPKEMVVAVPVADIRAKPVPHNKKYKFDPVQETQVEKGEAVQVFEKTGKWFRVECPDQREFSHNSKWQGYPGWIEASALTADLTTLDRRQLLDVPQEELRLKIIAEARKHLGSPYLWGGRSLHDKKYKKTATGVDCSGLINWAFRQVGWMIPRDAHEQFMSATSRRPYKMKPADMIFLADIKNPHKIVHVMFYSGDGNILEAPQSGERVREMPFQERFGKPIREFKGGEVVGDRYLYFGSIFEN